MKNVKHQVSGVIFASGKGSRLEALSQQLGKPKHLFPLAKSSIISRTVQEFSQVCEQIICVVPPEQEKLFIEEFAQHHLSVEVVVKKQSGFQGDFLAATEKVQHQQVIITAGDLVFPQGEIEKFVQRTQFLDTQFVIAFDRAQLKKMKMPTIVDFRLVLGSLNKKDMQEVVNLNPESVMQLVFFALKQMLKGKIRLMKADVLFNINTIEDYQKAYTFFQKL